MKYFQIAEVTLLIVSSSYKALAFTTLSNKIRAPLQSLSSLSAVDDKTEVREYFNTEGFNRWNKIYSDSDEVNTVQMDIRTGHDQTISKILKWVESDGDMEGKTVCDCGCGVGSLAIPLAKMGEFICTINYFYASPFEYKNSRSTLMFLLIVHH